MSANEWKDQLYEQLTDESKEVYKSLRTAAMGKRAYNLVQLQVIVEINKLLEELEETPAIDPEEANRLLRYYKRKLVWLYKV